ncbi:hypothetical protein Y1Q_0002200 [Alligator mississippiensis]|uniref:Cytochrome P450 2J6-like n=1 Tax=Alligator mississippiensis TaxID=8496 RepID=A0A151PDL6_ALLMI|nr:hypothetical protein Y1Q_0002200 [Alligator mississippiensis]
MESRSDMLMISEVLIFLVVSLVIAQFLKLQWAHRQLPPGPMPLPIFGSLWQLNFQANHKMLEKLAKLHGNIFTFWLGHTPAVVLYRFQAVKDGLTTHPEDVSGRMETPVFKQMANGKGILLSNGHTWKQQRRFGIISLRKLGMGKKSLEHRIQKEAHHLVDNFMTTNEKPLDPTFPVVHAVSNVMSAVVFGHRFSRDDETFHRLIEAFDCIVAFGNSLTYFLCEILPGVMQYLPGPQKKALACCEFIHSFIRKEIESHRESGIADESQDFIDCYLEQMAKTKDEPNSTYDEDNMIQSIFDLFMAGTETTTTTMRWALMFMVLYPDIQEKVQQELDAVLGPSHTICYEDRKKLPYTNAVIHEIQRYGSIVLITIPRKSVKDTVLLGYPIPKGTLVIPVLDSALYDPEQWEIPKQFNPNHFLDKDGNFVSREAFLPFSAGHRFLKVLWARRRLPPGPVPFPVLGNLFQMNFRIHHETLKKMAKTHGHIFTLWLANVPVVVLQGFQAVKDGLTTHAEDVSARPKTAAFDVLTNGNGIMFSNGHVWKQQRRFCFMILRKLGTGKEHRIQEEASHLVEHLDNMKGRSLDPSLVLGYTVANVICAVAFGHRFSLEDKHFHKLIEIIADIIAYGNSSFYFLHEYVPWLMDYIPGPHKKTVQGIAVVRSIIREEIRSCEKCDRTDEPENFIDFYLAQTAKAKEDPKSTYEEDNLVQSIFDLFVAGIETTTTTLRWALLYMLVYPDIQEKVQQELDAVLGPSHTICYEDRKKLPYTNAVIHEILRYSRVVLIALPRASVRDTDLLGFSVPKNTIILSNIDSVLTDPGQWETPEEFNPNHFLDKDGNFVSREAFLPFSTDRLSDYHSKPQH